MVTLSYTIDIKATAEKIWDILWDENTYREWTKFFSEGSQYRSDWKIHGRTYFLDASGENGMVSTIESLRKPYEVVFKHLGMLENGVEDTNSKEVMEWSGSQEKYFLTEFEGYTKLVGEVQTLETYEEHMKKGFENGFEVVRRLAEQK
jgi:hypothetical protein